MESYQIRGGIVIITVKVSGGFAGLEETPVAQVDTTTLPEERRKRIEDRVAALSTLEPVIGSDMMQYRIEIEDQSGHREITVIDAGEPQGPIQELLTDLSGA